MSLNEAQRQKKKKLFLLLTFRKSFHQISIDKTCLFVSDLRCQVWPKPLNPECGGFPSVPRRQRQGRVPWLGEPLSVCCLSCRASTAARHSHGGVWDDRFGSTSSIILELKVLARFWPRGPVHQLIGSSSAPAPACLSELRPSSGFGSQSGSS